MFGKRKVKDNNSYQKSCKFGSDCKYGDTCRFYHPQKYSEQEKLFNNNQQCLIQNPNDLQKQFTVLSINQRSQQSQNYSCKNQSHKMKKQRISKHINKKNQSSSDSNSDNESNSEEQSQRKQRTYINPDEKFQQIQSLKEEQKMVFKKKKKFHQMFQQKPFDFVSYELYQQSLFQFFEKRHIKQFKRQKILFFLSKQLTYKPQIVQYIVYIVEQLQIEGFVQHFCYKRIIKTICKQQFIMENIKAKLLKKINVDQKRRKKQDDLNQRFPNPLEVEFLQSSDLIENQLKNKNKIYLIDGNNCLTTQKHLRYFFQKSDTISKAEAQMRFRWLISLVIDDPKRCYIFFDDKYGDEIYQKLYDELMTGKDYKDMISSSTVIYAEKDQEADQCIRKKVLELKQNGDTDTKGLVLITGDRALIQQCYQIHPLVRSSGSYLIKFVRKMVKLRQKQRPQLKKKMKKILSYD